RYLSHQASLGLNAAVRHHRGRRPVPFCWILRVLRVKSSKNQGRGSLGPGPPRSVRPFVSYNCRITPLILHKAKVPVSINHPGGRDHPFGTPTCVRLVASCTRGVEKSQIAKNRTQRFGGGGAAGRRGLEPERIASGAGGSRDLRPWFKA